MYIIIYITCSISTAEVIFLWASFAIMDAQVDHESQAEWTQLLVVLKKPAFPMWAASPRTSEEKNSESTTPGQCSVAWMSSSAPHDPMSQTSHFQSRPTRTPPSPTVKLTCNSSLAVPCKIQIYHRKIEHSITSRGLHRRTHPLFLPLHLYA